MSSAAVKKAFGFVVEIIDLQIRKTSFMCILWGHFHVSIQKINAETTTTRLLASEEKQSERLEVKTW